MFHSDNCPPPQIEIMTCYYGGAKDSICPIKTNCINGSCCMSSAKVQLQLPNCPNGHRAISQCGASGGYNSGNNYSRNRFGAGFRRVRRFGGFGTGFRRVRQSGFGGFNGGGGGCPQGKIQGSDVAAEWTKDPPFPH